MAALPRQVRASRAALASVVVVVVVLVGTAARADDTAAAATARRATQEGANLLSRGALDQAVERFEEALRLVPASANARRNLALGLARRAAIALRQGDGAAALADLDRAIELHPGRLHYETLQGRALLLLGRRDEALRTVERVLDRSAGYVAALVLLADVQERRGDLEAAREAVQHVLALRAGDAGFEQRRAELERRIEVESSYRTHGSGHFQVRYDPDADPETVRLALTLLEDAYTHVTADLGVTPRTPARVVLYGGGEFQKVTGVHSWVGALYARGTLRVPIRNLERHRRTAARVLAHEFTHHVLKERTPSLPIWWHEGIAQVMESGDGTGAARREHLDAILARWKAEGRLLDLAKLRGTHVARSARAGLAQVFYAQAFSFVGWLVDRQGPGGLPRFLVALGTGTDVDAAARHAFGETVATLFRTWRDEL